MDTVGMSSFARLSMFAASRTHREHSLTEDDLDILGLATTFGP